MLLGRRAGYVDVLVEFQPPALRDLELLRETDLLMNSTHHYHHTASSPFTATITAAAGATTFSSSTLATTSKQTTDGCQDEARRCLGGGLVNYS